MAETLDSLRKMVVAEVRKKRQAVEAQAKIKPASNAKLSRDQFAAELDIETPLADALLTGFLPASEIDDDFLADIAAVIGHEVNTLRIILGRVIVPTYDDVDDLAGV
jgi:hypothetical protein